MKVEILGFDLHPNDEASESLRERLGQSGQKGLGISLEEDASVVENSL